MVIEFLTAYEIKTCHHYYSLITVCGEVYSIQHYMIQFVSDILDITVTMATMPISYFLLTLQFNGKGGQHFPKPKLRIFDFVIIKITYFKTHVC